MSSEATTFFPDSLAGTSEVRGPAQSPSEAPQKLQLGSEESGSRADLTAIGEISDELLLEQLSQGTKEALAILFRRHARAVRNVACRILRDEAEAEDLVQDVFIFLFRKAALFNPLHGTARSWIVQVAYHRAFDRRRYLNTRRFYSSRGVEDAAEKLADARPEKLFTEWSLEGVWGKESAARLRNYLSPAQLATIELYFFKGLTLEEIAEHLGQTLGNVRNHYHRGLEKLRKPAFANKLRPK
jgi:RNA polymerase sigma-70 factor (ECF subfamily)